MVGHIFIYRSLLLITLINPFRNLCGCETFKILSAIIPGWNETYIIEMLVRVIQLIFDSRNHAPFEEPFLDEC